MNSTQVAQVQGWRRYLLESIRLEATWCACFTHATNGINRTTVPIRGWSTSQVPETGKNLAAMGPFGSRVGKALENLQVSEGSPHASGGEPRPIEPVGSVTAKSPREWG